MTPLTEVTPRRETLDEFVARAARDAPPLGPKQRARIASLLASVPPVAANAGTSGRGHARKPA